MSENTAITWANDTFNTWWGCHKVSAECLHCYAEATAERFHPGHWGLKQPRWFFGDKHWNEPRKWNAKAKRDGVRRRVFCSSMADVFELHPVPEIKEKQDEARARLWALILETPDLDWLLLTKRPENFATMLPWRVSGDPWSTVWLGVTAGVLASLDRVKILRDTPAAVRYVSCEPILEHIPAEAWDKALGNPGVPRPVMFTEREPLLQQYADHWSASRIHWLIVGDESGKNRRPASANWVRTARDAAARHGVAFHLKQWAGEPQDGIEGTRTTGRNGKIHLPMLDGTQHAEFPGGRR